MSGGGTNETVTQQSIDPYLRQRHIGLFNDATRYLAQTPYQAYGFPQIAPLQPFQTAAQQYLSQAILPGSSLGFQVPGLGGPYDRSPFSFTGYSAAPGIPAQPPPVIDDGTQPPIIDPETGEPIDPGSGDPYVEPIDPESGVTIIPPGQASLMAGPMASLTLGDGLSVPSPGAPASLALGPATTSSWAPEESDIVERSAQLQSEMGDLSGRRPPTGFTRWDDYFYWRAREDLKGEGPPPHYGYPEGPPVVGEEYGVRPGVPLDQYQAGVTEPPIDLGSDVQPPLYRVEPDGTITPIGDAPPYDPTIYPTQPTHPTYPTGPMDFGTGDQGVGFGEMDAAANAAGSLTGYNAQQVQPGSFLDGDIGAYMNPYQSAVINEAMGDLNRARQMANVDTASAATQANAWGGSRHGLLEAETNRNFFDRVGNISAQLRNQNFDTAAGLMGGDLSRQLTAGLANQQAGLGAAGLRLGAAGQLGALGGQRQGMTFDAGRMLMGLGSGHQALAQQMIDADRQQFYEARNDPLRGFGLLQGILSGMPVGMSQTTYEPTSGVGGFLGGGLGGLAAGLGGGLTFAANPLALGGLGLLGGLSKLF